MASFFRWRVADKVIPLLSKYSEKGLKTSEISSFVKVCKFKSNQPQLYLPWKEITNLSLQKGELMSPAELVKTLRNQGLPTAEGFIDISLSQSPLSLVFTVDRHVFSKVVLTDICGNDQNMAKSSCIFQDVPKRNVVVQCSSPGIGNIFSMNHFRSALHCNFIANINELAGHQVKRVTQVDDAGLKAAALLKEYQAFGSEEELLKNPSYHLSEVAKAAMFKFQNDLDFQDKVRCCLEEMDSGDRNTCSDWRHLKEKCLKQHSSIYKKIGLTFDDTHFDSCYSSEIKKLQKELEQKQLLFFEDGILRINIPEVQNVENKFQIDDLNSMSSDLLRAVFNVVITMDKHNFDDFYYVAPSSQKHFVNIIFSLIKQMGFRWSENLHHVQLKNISHFESKGKKQMPVVDLLKRARILMLDRLKTDLKLEVDSNLEAMGESLGYASMCIHDMKYKRNVDYPFNWNEVLSLGKDCGASLQLFHAGLKGLQEDSPRECEVDIDTSAILETEAHDLILHLSRFDEIVSKALLTLQPSVVIEYLFTLRYLTDKAAKKIKLDKKHVKHTVIKARLLLLNAALKILKTGLHLIGIEPFVNSYSAPDL